MNAYQVEVLCFGKRLDVFVNADTPEEAETVAWGHDDHYEVRHGETLQVERPHGAAATRGVQAVLPVKIVAVG